MQIVSFQFSGKKNEKNIIDLSSAEFAHSVLRVKRNNISATKTQEEPGWYEQTLR